jgi:1-deoxy-D-xylulose-5-phosphate reductoisomerase
MPGIQHLAILGSTGSIGRNTLDIVSSFPDQLSVDTLVSHRNWKLLFEQAAHYHAKHVVVTDATCEASIDRSLLPTNCELHLGSSDLRGLIQSNFVDTVVSAIVGAAGLHGTWYALEAGKKVALANKETLVVAGELITRRFGMSPERILPVDSEHSAIFQAIQGNSNKSIERVILTASGGPFRGKKLEELLEVTPEAALKHPTWQMGPKITIDSATLMNKSLEIIEAHWLFGLSDKQIDVILHPDSIVHSFVEFCDGSILGQLSPPDMRLPIQYALLWPERLPGPTKRLDWSKLQNLRFEAPDRTTFAALELGYEVIRMGGVSGAVLNAANEVAVSRFLNHEIRFLDIAEICRTVLDGHPRVPNPELDDLWAADSWARSEVTRWRRT